MIFFLASYCNSLSAAHLVQNFQTAANKQIIFNFGSKTEPETSTQREAEDGGVAIGGTIQDMSVMLPRHSYSQIFPCLCHSR